MRTIRRLWRQHEYFSIGLLWAAIVVALFRDALFTGPDRVVGGNDVTYAYLPWLRFTVESVRQGIFPLWNPYVFSGTPFAGNPQTGLFYPATWLALWVGPERAFGLSTALHVWIAAMGMYGWLRQLRATRAGAFFSSTAYALSGFISARIWAGHYGPLLEAALFPALLWWVTRALQRRSVLWAILAGAPFGLMILAGHTPTFVLLALGAGIFVVFESILLAAENTERTEGSERSALSTLKSFLAILSLFGVTALAGAALAAVQILPALTFVENSARVANISTEFAARFSLPPAHLMQMLIPDFFGEPVRSGYWGAEVFEEYIYYVGVPALILAFLSLFTGNVRARFFVAFGLFGLAVALGPNGGVYTLLYRFVPFFDLLRAPARAGMWTVFTFSAAAGLCLSALQVAAPQGVRRTLSKWPLWLIVLLCVAGLLGAALAHARFGASAGLERFLAGDIAVFVALLVVTSALIQLWQAQVERDARWSGLLIGLLLIDLGAYHANIVQMAPSVRGAPYAAAGRALGDALNSNRLIWVYANLFELNLGMDFGQYNVYGYDSLITARLQAMVDRARALSSPIYDLLNVRYVISQSPISEGVNRIGEEGGYFFYERPNAAPRAWIVHAVESVADEAAVLDRVSTDFDPAAVAVVAGSMPCAVEVQVGVDHVTILRYEPNRIEAQIDAGASGVLIFSEIDYPGWAASVDGAPAQIHRVNYGLRGICLPEGSHIVSMVYDLQELKLGIGISLAALIGIVGTGFRLKKRTTNER